MQNLNRREEDRNPSTKVEQSFHYRRKPNEAHEISEFLKLCVNSHSMKINLWTRKVLEFAYELFWIVNLLILYLK